MGDVMSYLRVIPRDLFNEASLLKCYGQLYLNLEKMGLEGRLVHEADDEHFEVNQNPNDGAIGLGNITLWDRDGDIDVRPCHLYRPLNSRKPYPLWLRYGEEDDIPVFNDDGAFTDEMVAFLKADHSL